MTALQIGGTGEATQARRGPALGRAATARGASRPALLGLPPGEGTTIDARALVAVVEALPSRDPAPPSVTVLTRVPPVPKRHISRIAVVTTAGPS